MVNESFIEWIFNFILDIKNNREFNIWAHNCPLGFEFCRFELENGFDIIL